MSWPARVAAARRRLPENVRTLGWVSLANDSASEFSYPIIPLFLTITLGAPVVTVGVIEGIAEATAIVFRFLSGWLSDRLGERRRPWIIAGYSISTFARALIAAAPSWGWVLGGRIADRVGKGTRGTPRDALIRDSTPKELLGSAFGYHRAADTVGAVLGPLAAVVLLELGFSFRSVLWCAVVPGLVTLVLLRRIREAPEATVVKRKVALERVPLPPEFWVVLGIWVIFSLGNSSDVFLLLRAGNLGLDAIAIVLAYAVYNVVYASLSWPLGALSDRVPRHVVLGCGVLVFAGVYLALAAARSGWVVWPAFALYGVYIAATEGVARAWVADHVGEYAIATAYGVFFLGTAAAALVASVVAGILWTYVGPSAPFVVGALAALVAATLLAGFSLIRRVDTRAVQALLAVLTAAVLFGIGFAHGSWAALMRRPDAADVLPLAATRACGPAPAARAVRSPVIVGFPKPDGAVYSAYAASGPELTVDGYLPAPLAGARDAYLRTLDDAGFGVTETHHDPIESELKFEGGGRAGELQLKQICRSRTALTLRLGGAD